MDIFSDPLLRWCIYFFVFLLGLTLGSFLNSWMWRQWDNIRITVGRSVCVFCHRRLRWFENIPVVSYILIRGYCRTCKRKIPSHYIMVELFTAAALVILTWHHANHLALHPWLLFRNTVFVLLLILIFVFDALYKIILPSVVWLGVLVGLWFNYVILDKPLWPMLLGALIAGGFFLAQFLVSRGKWIGGGDVRMGVMMGVWLGWPEVLVALFVAYMAGALVAAFLLIFKKKEWRSKVPFGAFLAVGTFLALYKADDLIAWYGSLIR